MPRGLVDLQLEVVRMLSTCSMGWRPRLSGRSTSRPPVDMRDQYRLCPFANVLSGVGILARSRALCDVRLAWGTFTTRIRALSAWLSASSAVRPDDVGQKLAPGPPKPICDTAVVGLTTLPGCRDSGRRRCPPCFVVIRPARACGREAPPADGGNGVGLRQIDHIRHLDVGGRRRWRRRCSSP